jgi:hypothetical protein
MPPDGSIGYVRLRVVAPNARSPSRSGYGARAYAKLFALQLFKQTKAG